MQWHISDIITIISIIIEMIIIPLIMVVIARHKRIKKDIELEKKGTQAILRNELLHLSYQYLDDGFIEYTDKLNYENRYNAYHNLGTKRS